MTVVGPLPWGSGGHDKSKNPREQSPDVYHPGRCEEAKAALDNRDVVMPGRARGFAMRLSHFGPQVPILVAFVPPLLVVQLKSLTGDTWFSAVRSAFSGFHPLALLLQFYMLFAFELLAIYALIRTRRGEVFVFSHARLVVAIFLTAASGLLGYRIVIWLVADHGLFLYIVFAILAILVGTGLVGVLQATFVEILNAIRPEPFIKDAARPEQIGKIGDCNPWVVRRWGQFMWVWFLSVPGLLVLAPLPDWLSIALFTLGMLVALRSWFHTAMWWIEPHL